MSSVYWMDPRLTVFIIWGLCVTLFLCYPSKHIVAKIFHRMGFPCCAEVEEPERVRPRPSSENEVDYEHLSNARKQEIDSLRSIALLRHLSPFSMAISKDDMLRRATLSTLHFNESKTPPPYNPESVSDPQCKEELSNTFNDVEQGIGLPACAEQEDPPSFDKQEHHSFNGEEKVEICECHEAEECYTHVMLPFPGQSVVLAPVALPVKSSKYEKQPSAKRIFSPLKERKGKEKQDAKNDDTDEKQQQNEKRDASIFCAICLMEYEISERVCWSSNPDCTHVFHEDCIVNWLISLGRTKSKMQRFSENPSEAQLLNYGLDCPCCRRDFISKEARAEHPNGDERV